MERARSLCRFYKEMIRKGEECDIISTINRLWMHDDQQPTNVAVVCSKPSHALLGLFSEDGNGVRVWNTGDGICHTISDIGGGCRREDCSGDDKDDDYSCNWFDLQICEKMETAQRIDVEKVEGEIGIKALELGYRLNDAIRRVMGVAAQRHDERVTMEAAKGMETTQPLGGEAKDAGTTRSV